MGQLSESFTLSARNVTSLSARGASWMDFHSKRPSCNPPCGEHRCPGRDTLCSTGPHPQSQTASQTRNVHSRPRSTMIYCPSPHPCSTPSSLYVRRSQCSSNFSCIGKGRKSSNAYSPLQFGICRPNHRNTCHPERSTKHPIQHRVCKGARPCNCTVSTACTCASHLEPWKALNGCIRCPSHSTS